MRPTDYHTTKAISRNVENGLCVFINCTDFPNGGSPKDISLLIGYGNLWDLTSGRAIKLKKRNGLRSRGNCCRIVTERHIFEWFGR